MTEFDFASYGLERERLPTHVAIIMDGNGRWARARGLERTAGHAAGEHSLFTIVKAALAMGLQWLTVYAFSTENWNRPDDEVEFLMHFNESLLLRRRDEVDADGVRVHFIGLENDPRVPVSVQNRMAETQAMTAGNTNLNLVFAFNYGSRAELARAARAIAAEVAHGAVDPAQVDEETISAHLYLPEMPDPELIIRTSGEQRLSNFLTWQAAYAEFVFTDVLWPDFDEAVFAGCLAEYQRRGRRFGSVEDSPS